MIDGEFREQPWIAPTMGAVAQSPGTNFEKWLAGTPYLPGESEADAERFSRVIARTSRVQKRVAEANAKLQTLTEDTLDRVYGALSAEQVRRSAHIVDKILRGTKPAEIPVEQPTRFELLVNLRTARTLGITIPHSILIQAESVIE